MVDEDSRKEEIYGKQNHGQKIVSCGYFKNTGCICNMWSNNIFIKKNTGYKKLFITEHLLLVI